MRPGPLRTFGNSSTIEIAAGRATVGRSESHHVAREALTTELWASEAVALGRRIWLFCASGRMSQPPRSELQYVGMH
jgi:hypothetical protein